MWGTKILSGRFPVEGCFSILLDCFRYPMGKMLLASRKENINSEELGCPLKHLEPSCPCEAKGVETKDTLKLTRLKPVGVSKNIGIPQNGWFIWENPMNPWMIWGYHYHHLRKHPYWSRKDGPKRKISPSDFDFIPPWEMSDAPPGCFEIAHTRVHWNLPRILGDHQQLTCMCSGL